MTSINIVFTEGAKQDLFQAHRWYKGINVNLGEDF
jgi:hypothetical protein